MKFRFLLHDVIIDVVEKIEPIDCPIYEDAFVHLTPNSFQINIPQVATISAQNGTEIQIQIHGEPQQEIIELYLNGSVLGAILHQRGILPMHASSFIYSGKTILLCGNSGAGKSTTTAAFCLQGGEFLTDDITPLIFQDGVPRISPISDSLKLWKDTVDELEIPSQKLREIQPERNKFYYSLESKHTSPIAPDVIIHLISSDIEIIEVRELSGTEKFESLLNQVYRNEYLDGMKEVKAEYLHPLIQLSNEVPVFEIKRPRKIDPSELIKKISDTIL
ncbi:MAG: hypothetical protein QNK23_04380 [Crocinitomicaceae bacterium]|nr:hypothetical protein [Crocinitomicaceae bacterium]